MFWGLIKTLKRSECKPLQSRRVMGSVIREKPQKAQQSTQCPLYFEPSGSKPDPEYQPDPRQTLSDYNIYHSFIL